MSRTREWVITIRVTEVEGRDTTVPWYSEDDVRGFVRTRLDYLNPPRDLKFGKISATVED